MTVEKKSLSRSEFLCSGCRLALALPVIQLLNACVNTEEAEGMEFEGTITLTTQQKISLDQNLYVNLDEGLIVIKDGSIYRAFTRRCPHQAGRVTARSYMSLECERHIGQKYNQTGAGNGFRTTVTLRSYTVVDNGGTLTVSS